MEQKHLGVITVVAILIAALLAVLVVQRGALLRTQTVLVGRRPPATRYPFAPMTITPKEPSSGSVGVPYRVELHAEAAGGDRIVHPLMWSVVTVDGLAFANLPPGLSLDANSGIISGYPTTQGRYIPVVRVQDAEGKKGEERLIMVIAAPRLVITTADLQDASVGTAYSAQLRAEGGSLSRPPVRPESFVWSITDGKLPDGLSLDANSGIIGGTPTTQGTYSFTVRVTDATAAEAMRQLTIYVFPPQTPP